MKVIVIMFVVFMSSCAFSSFGREGEEVIYKHDISGFKLGEFKASFSSAGRLTFQQIRFSVEGLEIERSNSSKSIVVEVFVENLSTSDYVQFSDNDFIAERFDAVILQPGKRKKVHRSFLGRASGKNYFDVRISRLTDNSLPLNFNVKFSEELPSETIIIAKVLWADGP